MASTSAAVFLSAPLLHDAMSPAPLRTASVSAEADGDAVEGDEVAGACVSAGVAVASGASVPCALGVWDAAAAAGSGRRVRLRAPKRRSSVAAKMTRTSATERLPEAGSGVDPLTRSGYRDLAQGILEPSRGRVPEEPLEVGGRVRDEIDVEAAHALLEDAPHRLAEVRYDAHQCQTRQALTSDGAVVRREKRLVLFGRQAVVDAEVAEVEERVAHPGIFPVDDPDARPVVDEVPVEEVVVAGSELDRCGEEAPLDAPPDRGGLLVLGRDRNAALLRERTVRLRDPERHEQARDGRALVDPSERIRDSADRVGSMDRLVRHRGADDEPRDEIALGSDEGGHLRPDADAGSGNGRRMLHLPRDAQQVRVVAGQADDPALVRSGRVHPEVAVGDPARQMGQGEVTSGDLRDLLHRPDELLVQRATQDRVIGH